jgi:hypothetical protein
MAFDVLAELRDTCDALTEPHEHREPIFGWDKNRHKIKLGDHKIVRPGLFAQVHELIYPGTPPDTGDFAVRSVPGSRPPLRTDAASAYLQVHLVVTRWCVSLSLDLRDTIESSIRALLGRIGTEDRDTQVALLSELRSWRYQCELITGLRDPDPHLQVPCPHCGDRSLRVSMADRTARCTHEEVVDGEKWRCGAWWDEESIGVLARHITTFTANAKADADRVRAEERARKDAERRARDVHRDTRAELRIA